MSKLTRAQKIEIYEKRKSGQTISVLRTEYGVSQHIIKNMIRLIDQHGTEILRGGKNRYYSPEFKLEVINRILMGKESVMAVAIELGLSSHSIIQNWIKKYQENGYNVVEYKRGRPSMTKLKTKPNKNLTPEEKVRELEKQLEYLEAENEYLKKLNNVVKQRVEREKKKKPE